jgi:hypothetical protein
MDRDFWKARHEWPPDQEGHVFLARAAEQVGNKLFGAAWDAELSAFDAVLGDPVPDISPLADMPAGIRSRDEIGMFQARHRVHRVQEAAVRTGEAQKRLNGVLNPVLEVLRAWAAAGALGTALRPVDGGQLEPMPPHYWSTDRGRIATRFMLCRMSGGTPFDGRAKGNGFVFVEERGLQTLLDALSPADRSPTSAAPLSPPPNRPPTTLVDPPSVRPVADDSEAVEQGAGMIVGSRAEKRGIELIARLLGGDKNLTRKEADEALVASRLAVSALGFKTRVWPKAREMAGLPERAPPGPKPRRADT